MQKAFVFNIQKYSLHDGDGIRTTIFFKGCPLSCLWCHNPEGLSPRPQIAVYPGKCRSCGLCVSTCPNGIALACGLDRVDFSNCSACGACADACVHGARELAGKSYTPEELIQAVARDMAFYTVSGGGVTLSGGEVMTQNRDFLLELVSGLKRKGLQTIIDTCGYAPFEMFEAVLPFVELFLYDVKFHSSESHMRFTGRDNALILENLQKLSDRGAKLHVRIPVIEGVNADDGEMDAIACHLAEHIRAERIVLLPYHSMGRDKYSRFGLSEPALFSAPDMRRMEELAEKFRHAGFPHVQTGG